MNSYFGERVEEVQKTGKVDPKLLQASNNSGNAVSQVKNITIFTKDEACSHFSKHGNSVMKALGKNEYNIANYIHDANHVIKNGQWVPELNAYVKMIGGKGGKYAFVGIDRMNGHMTTFHIKYAKELAKTAPSLGIIP